MCVDTDVHPHIPEGSLCQQGSERGTPRFPYLTNPSQQGGNWAAYILANANPKIWSCLVHWAQQRCSLKERQMLRELHNPPRQMQKKKRIWKYPSVFQQPITGDWLWKKNCWYDLRTQATVVSQSAHNDGPAKTMPALCSLIIQPQTQTASPWLTVPQKQAGGRGNLRKAAGYLLS